jgi:hypothetical protein
MNVGRWRLDVRPPLPIADFGLAHRFPYFRFQVSALRRPAGKKLLGRTARRQFLPRCKAGADHENLCFIKALARWHWRCSCDGVSVSDLNFVATSMKAVLENLIHALREELQQHGEMLARLEQQHQHAIGRTADDLLRASVEIERQSQAVQGARRRRLIAQLKVAQQLQLPEAACMAELLPLLPEDYRPLVEALVQENGESLQRIFECSRQNHLLLCRSVELMNRVVGDFKPGEAGVNRDEQKDAMPGPQLVRLPAPTLA